MPHQPLPRGASIEVLSAPNIFFQPLALPLPLAGSILIVYDLLRHGAFDDTRILPKNALMAWKWSGRQGFFFCFATELVLLSLHTACILSGNSAGLCYPQGRGRSMVLAIQWEYTLQSLSCSRLMYAFSVCFTDLCPLSQSFLPRP